MTVATKSGGDGNSYWEDKILNKIISIAVVDC